MNRLPRMNQQVHGTESVAKAACSTPRSEAFARPAGLLIWLAFAALYLVTLDRSGFWLDEVSTLLDIRRPFLDMIQARAVAGHGPVYFSFAWLWVRLVGESEWLLRLPSVLAWLLVVALAAQLVAKRLGEWVAVLAVSLLLVTPPLVYLAQIARPYMLSVLLVMLALWWTLRIPQPARIRDIGVLALLVALALNTHYSAAIPLGALLIWVLARAQPDWRLASGIVTGALGVLPVLIYLLTMRTPGAPIAWIPHADLTVVLRMPAALALTLNEILPGWWPYMSAAFAILALYGGLQGGRLDRLLLVVWLLSMLAVAITILAGGPNLSFVDRYFGVAGVAQMLLVVASLGVMRPLGVVPMMVLSAPLFLLLSAYLHMSLISAVFPDWREAIRFLETRRGAGEKVFMIENKPVVPQYYIDSTGSDARVIEIDRKGEGINFSRTPDLSGSSGRFWVLVGQRAKVRMRARPARVVEQFLKASGRLAGRSVRVRSERVVRAIHVIEFEIVPEKKRGPGETRDGLQPPG